MKPAAAVDAVLAIFRRDPGDLFPFYIFSAAVPAVSQVIMLSGLAVVYAYLATTGRIAELQTELAAVDLEPPSPEAEPELVAVWAEQFLPILEILFPPVVQGVLIVTLALAIVSSIVLFAAVSAGQLSVCYARLQSDRGLPAGIAGVRRYWLTFLGLLVLEGILWIGMTVGLIGIVAVAFAIATVFGLFVAIAAFAVWTLLAIGIRAVFAFTPPAVVVEDVGVIGALRGSVSFIRANVASALIYYVVAIGLLGGFGTLVSTLSVVGMGSFAALFGLFLITPGLDLFKTGLYGGARGTVSPPGTPTTGLREGIIAGIRRGLNEMVGFIRATPLLHGLAVGLLATGFVVGWTLAAPYESLIEASIAARLEGHIPPVAALEFFGNNWTVALTVAFAGVLLGIPTAFTLWFNGFMFGGYFRLEANLSELVAFVVPHGVLELPAIFIAGALGFSLAASAWRAFRGNTSRQEFADDLERAFWIAVGIGILLLLAAIIEGFVSPYYYRPFLTV